ncbi:MAG: carbohydrate kinase family protein [Rhizobiaceae bacterium]|nr:carbohydrate kinase family protein [Rhizobiaceae bacterium]
MKAGVAIIGYASLDHVAMLDAVPTPGRTATIVDRRDEAWPRLGGSPAYVAAALAAAGMRGTCPISWVGKDDAGQRYVEQLRARHVAVEGVAMLADARTPIAILAYDPAGGCSCLYDPGMPADLALTEAQRGLIADADWLCVTIGPAAATRAALDALRPDAKLAWVVKDDPRAMPGDLAARLAGRADLICHSRAEAGFLDAALAGAREPAAGQIVIETRGEDGATARRDDQSVSVPTAPIETADPTGAGDTFAGGTISALAGGETDLRTIIEAGHRAARALLGRRQASST